MLSRVKSLFKTLVSKPPTLEELEKIDLDDNTKKEVALRARSAAYRARQLQIEADTFDYQNRKNA